MSVTVELSELDAFLWDAFKRGGEWVAASEYRKLMAENAELRESLEYANNEWEKESVEYLSTQDQNAKLRELVRDLWEACPVDGYYCIYHCKHYDKESESHCKLEDRMRELEIEAG